MTRNPRFTAGAIARGVVAALLAAFFFNSCTTAVSGPVKGQAVVFFPSPVSVLNETQWRLTIQGRVFEPTEKSRGREALIDALAPLIGANPADPLYRQRARFFLSDSNRNISVSVKLGDRVIALPASDPGGYFTGDVALAGSEVMPLATEGLIAFQSVATAGNPERFPGRAMLVPEEGVSVITDMDDTIKITDILNHKEKVANTFLRPFRAVPGMSALYRSWLEALGPRIHFHVVSAGPWQLNEPLRRFTEEAGFPAFTWDMRSVDVGDIRVLLKELDSDPYEFKVQKIRAFMTRFPKRHAVLVGDSGEKDPEVYGKILSEFPARVDAVFIRNVSGNDRKDRYRALFPSDEAAAKLRVFLDPKELPPLATAGESVRGQDP